MESEQNLVDEKAMDLILQIIGVVDNLPKNGTTKMMGEAIIRSAADAVSHYLDSGKAKTIKEFIRDIYLMKIQLNQTNFWLNMLELNTCSQNIKPLIEANTEILHMVATILQTATSNENKITEQHKLAKERAMREYVSVLYQVKTKE